MFVSNWYRTVNVALFGVCMALLVSCGVPEVTGPACKEKVCTVEVSEGKRTIVDATDKEKWIFVSLATGQQVEVGDPASDNGWDLAFRRVEIKSNGGTSGKGGVKIAILKETSLTSVTAPPEEKSFTADQDDADNDGVPEYVFLQEGKWYNYDLGTHLLNPKTRVYVIRATDGNHYKLQMHSYYNDDKVSGFPSFTWSLLK